MNKIESYLAELCVRLSDRHLGSAGNLVATDYFRRTIAAFGYRTEAQMFQCIDWEDQGVGLRVGQETFAARPSPYSLPYVGRAPLAKASTICELERVKVEGCILVLHGEIAKEQLMPKKFPFYNPDHHQTIIALLEKRNPTAIIWVSQSPIIEDGDFDIPSVYLSPQEGDRLLSHVGQEALLSIESRRIPSLGCNVAARKGAGSQRVVFCAHIDTKKGSPGALDNATGVSILLLLAEMLQEYDGELGVEFVALNGEDYYAASGQLLYLTANQGLMEQIVLAVNFDGAGYHNGRTSFALFGCPDQVASLVRNRLSPLDEFVETGPWYQSDHMIFVQQGRPAIAVTTEQMEILTGQIAHTERDLPDLVEQAKLLAIAEGFRKVFLDLAELWQHGEL